MVDDEGIVNWTGAKQTTSQSLPEAALRMRMRLAGGHGSFPLVGSPGSIEGICMVFLAFGERDVLGKSASSKERKRQTSEPNTQ
jgi:hypothetical protein